MTQNSLSEPSSMFHSRVSNEDLRGKSAQLISHVEDEGTAVFETPLERLREHAITPTELVFMRNSYAIPPLTDLLEDVLGVIGRVDFPLMLEISQLRQDVTLETVMQCAGNGRAFFRDAQTLCGSKWERGGVANVQFSGVWLRDVLSRDNIKPEAQFLTARGHDSDGNTFYEKSVPLEDALAYGFLARGMNGEALSRTHGGPLRLIMPGYFATVNVKWLSSLILSEFESENEAQQGRYRTPDGGACWRMPLKSVVWSPLEGETLTRKVVLSGAAWNDGSSAIERVDISLDRGEHWLETVLERFSERPAPDWPPLDSESERFAWIRWSLNLGLKPGQYEVWSRATDAAGNVQLLEGDEHWNPDGYEWSGVDRVCFTVG
ncbi:MAG: molybdopterin-dependent oxidoreductase [Pseudopedobacter sp.]|nr:molybdopterin-dependent oxidoreductase [Deinococcales bacterium]